MSAETYPAIVQCKCSDVMSDSAVAQGKRNVSKSLDRKWEAKMSVNRAIGTVIGGLTLSLISIGAMADPWLSTPSVVFHGQTATVLGGGFTPGEDVTLRITDPAEDAISYVVEADNEGKISFSLQVDQSGQYVTEAWTLDGGPDQPAATAVAVATQ